MNNFRRKFEQINLKIIKFHIWYLTLMILSIFRSECIIGEEINFSISSIEYFLFSIFKRSFLFHALSKVSAIFFTIHLFNILDFILIIRIPFNTFRIFVQTWKFWLIINIKWYQRKFIMDSIQLDIID